MASATPLGRRAAHARSVPPTAAVGSQLDIAVGAAPAAAAELASPARQTASGSSATAPLFVQRRNGSALAVDHVRNADESGPTLTPAGRTLAMHRAAVTAEPKAPDAPVVPLVAQGNTARETGAEVQPKARAHDASEGDLRITTTQRNERPTPAQGVRAPDGARLTPSNQSAGRPPVLASEALRKDLAPATPAGTPVRKVTVALGVVGLLGAFALCGTNGIGLPLGGTFLALALLGAVPMPYQPRAATLVTVAASGLAIVTWSKLGRSEDIERMVLLVGVLLLAVALLFRSWHRASLLARALVALGATVCTGWLAMSGAFQKLLVLEGQWQQWLPALMPLLLALVLLLSLLAFMDSRSTGGCSVWAALLLGWYTLYSWAELLPRYVRSAAGQLDLSRVETEFAVVVLSGPLFAVVLAAGLAQLLSVATAAEAD